MLQLSGVVTSYRHEGVTPSCTFCVITLNLFVLYTIKTEAIYGRLPIYRQTSFTIIVRTTKQKL